MAEFATNHNKLAFTKLFPFFATKDLHLCMSFEIEDLSNTRACERIFKQKALDFSRNMETT